jgi:uncharacterized membrane protein YdjX (TVP38/TMEM64 family)
VSAIEHPDPPQARAGSSAPRVWRAIVLHIGRYWRIVLGVLILGALGLSARGLPVMTWLESLADSIRAMGAWGILAYAAIYACAALLCFPCMPLTIAGGFILGTAEGAIAVHSGTCLAAAIGFLIGRGAGRARVATWLRDSKRFRFIDDAIRREGWKIVALLRMHAIPFGLSNYIYGMTAVPFWHYFVATALAMLPGTLVFVHLGAIGERRLSGESGMHPLEYGLIGFGVISLIAMGRVIRRIVRAQREAAAN